MILSTKKLCIATTTFVLYVGLTQGVFAGADDERIQKGQQCAEWAQTGAVGLSHARDCIIKCRSYEQAVGNNPKTADKHLALCNEAYLNVKREMSGTVKEAIPARVRDPNKPKYEPKLAHMPDVVGAYTGWMKGRFRVRADDRDDWNSICRGMARIKDSSFNSARQLRSFDRIRILGISYDSNRAGKGPLGNCNAESAVILGSSER